MMSIGLNSITRRVQRDIYGLIQPALITCYMPLHGTLWLPSGYLKIPPEVEQDVMSIASAKSVQDIQEIEDKEFLRHIEEAIDGEGA